MNRTLKAAIALACAGSAAMSAAAVCAKAPFDGIWDTALTCPNADGALGYVFNFPSHVTDGTLHGEKGERNHPGWFELNGKIGEDGVARLDASGLVGASVAAVGQRPAGAAYAYHVESKFMTTIGSGDRIEGRPCHVDFKRSEPN